jgi:hypothetical protein
VAELFQRARLSERAEVARSERAGPPRLPDPGRLAGQPCIGGRRAAVCVAAWRAAPPLCLVARVAPDLA